MTGGLRNPAVHSESVDGLLALGDEGNPLPGATARVMGLAMALDDPRFVTRSELLALRPYPPEALQLDGVWVAGDPGGLAGPVVAVVGCRAASEAGRARAEAIGRGLAEAGVCVISGLALGIDGGAHAGALAGGGATIGVLGGGHRCFFPRRNRALAEAMLARGAVISPYAPDEPARPLQFLERNALVAGLSDAVVVVEAAARSGALNTAGWAGDHHITVFAVPGDPDRVKAAGCNALIRDGAVLVRDVADVLAGIGLASRPRTVRSRRSRPIDPLEAAVLDALGREPRSLDELLEVFPRDPGVLLAALVRLELAGALERREDLRYARL